MEQITAWSINHIWEIFGAVSGLVFLILEVKENVWLWPVGILTSGLYVVVFFDSKFYADMALNVYYVVISVYGWYAWLYGRSSVNDAPLLITKTPVHMWKYLAASFLGMFLLMIWVLKNFTDSPVPIGDAFATALSLVATWMLTRKYIEQWWLWVVVDGVSLGLFLWKGLYPTSVLFFLYTTLAIAGYFQWRKRMEGSLAEAVVVLRVEE